MGEFEVATGAIARESETPRADGKIVVQPRGSISMLEEWLNTAVRLPDPGPKDQLLRELREIRKLRQKPAPDGVAILGGIIYNTAWPDASSWIPM